jgi:hypothetical protein
MRLGLGMALLSGAHYSIMNSTTDPDPWYDEFAVDVTPGSPTYGHAIASNPNNEAAIKAHKHWLGLATSDPYRVYDLSDFSVDNTLLENGDFGSGATGWQISNLASSVVPWVDGWANHYLQTTGHSTYQASQWNAFVRGPAVALTAGQECTVTFSARASSVREIELACNPSGSISVYYADTEWRRYVHTFVAQTSTTYRPTFRLGREDTGVDIADVRMFAGNANVFRRDFDNGTVVVNATPSQRTVDLKATFKRILGTGQDPVNNGATIKSVTLQPYDAAILVKPEQ